MFRSIGEIILRSKIKKENLNRKKQFLSWSNTEKIALVLSKADKINKSAMDKFIEGTGKFISVFYVETGSKLVTYADWQCFSKKDITFLGLPREKTLHDIRNKKFDLVINTSDDHDLFSAALTAALPATLKCGCGKTLNDVELIIKKGDPYHVIDYLNDVIKYLKMIKA